MLAAWAPFVFLAQVQLDAKDVDVMKDVVRNSSPKLFGADLVVVLSVALGLTAIVFFWAFFIRKRPKEARGALVVERAEKHSREAHGASGRRKRRKRRPDHPDNWGRNPTLGETGGLPPVRSQDPEAPSEPDSPPVR